MIFNPEASKLVQRIFLAFPLFASFLLLFALSGCAKIGSPTGGPKDITPPKVLESIPENKATQVSSKEIEITFDEFIVLKNLNEEFIISPPLKEKPVTRMRNKTLVIDLNNELKDSTTYTLNFGNAIADNNEGNLLPDYEFVFSTGKIIDSLSVVGKVLNALSLKPEKEKITIMLYENFSDSAPYDELPLYVTKSSPEGNFAINNVRPDTFRIFAIKDGNNNMKFDIPDEMIAFGDTLIVMSAEKVRKISYIKDSTAIKKKSQVPVPKKSNSRKDTAAVDTVKITGRELNALSVDLFLFTEEDLRQSIMEKNRERREMLKFVFNRPLFDSVKITPMNFSSADWALMHLSPGKDTLELWLTDSAVIKRDTITLAIAYTTTDSARNFLSRTDTVIMRFREKESKSISGRREKAISTNPDSAILELSTNIRNQGSADLNIPLVLISPAPVDTFNSTLIKLIRQEDTLLIEQPIVYMEDTSALFTVKYKTEWIEDLPYKLMILPGALTDIYGKSNDTLEIKFKTQKIDFYGKIIVSVEEQNRPIIIQLMDEKENRIIEKYLNESGQITFDFLPAKKYRLKAIFDDNNNKKWDTGNYLGRLQPEKVVFYPGIIELRSNWDVEINWQPE
jgi:hypothetical protein